MKWHHLVAVASLALPLMATGASAQQGRGAPATTADDGHPADIAFAKSNSDGFVYTDTHGLTLYAMNARFAAFFAGGGNGNPNAGNKYCADKCTQTWTALKASADAKPIGAWKVVEGAQGPQWAYKGDPVFTYTADKTGTVDGKEKDDLWRVLNYIPPVPKFRAPATVTAVFDGQEYVLEDGQGHALYTGGKPETNTTPFLSGMASQGVGNWTVSREGDHPQWVYKGQPVYIGSANQAPAGGTGLRPDEAETKAAEKPAKAPERVAASAQ
jgi:predicted lipoprotein with Yx(FWY)xxD motif